MDGESGFEDLAPSWGTGADGDFETPEDIEIQAEICAVCLFPLTACICKPERLGAEFTSTRAQRVRRNSP
jgi:hypothetical protein